MKLANSFFVLTSLLTLTFAHFDIYESHYCSTKDDQSCKDELIVVPAFQDPETTICGGVKDGWGPNSDLYCDRKLNLPTGGSVRLTNCTGDGVPHVLKTGDKFANFVNDVTGSRLGNCYAFHGFTVKQPCGSDNRLSYSRVSCLYDKL